MRKIFYNKFIKLFEMLCIIVAVAILMHEGINIAHEYKKNNAERQYVWDEYYNYEDMSREMYNEIVPYIEEIILLYKEQGMNGLSKEFNSDTEKWNRVVVTVVDAEQIIYDSDSPLDIRESFGCDELENVKQTGYSAVRSEFYNFTHRAGCVIHIDENAEVRFLNNFSEITETYDLRAFLSESTIQYLTDNKFDLNMCIRSSYYYVSEVECRYYDRYTAELERRGLREVVSIEESLIDRIPLALSCGLAIIVATVLLIISCGRKPNEKKSLNLYERGYTELHLFIIGAVGMNLLWGIDEYFEYYYELINEFEVAELNIINICVQIASVVGITWLYYEVGIIIKKLINRRLFKDLFVVRILIKIKKFIVDNVKKIKLHNNDAYVALPEIKRTYIWKIVIDSVIIILAFFALILALIMSPSTEAILLLYILAILFVAFYFIKSFLGYKHLGKYNRITEIVGTIYNGNYVDVKIDENENNETLIKLANLSDSFKESVKKQVEAEKMQIDLVANVSHDLDKPLEAIVNYIDLLKEEKMSDVARDYVKVLVDKSDRLKDIVKDVFDLAKATSGEQVEMEQIDGIVLVNQVLSDMNDRIEETGKDLRAKIEPETALIRGNGQKLYRVLQNVIDNALKYSMPGTRIYLNVENYNGEFVVTVKNVSEYEIDFTAEEIMSRFTRGDKSRHSEGNGLGLSIAKSFTELCGGSFEVKLDDDLFMVVIRLR